MKLYLDTSNFAAVVRLDDKEYVAELGHEMAEKLLGFIHEKLEENGKDWQDLTEIIYFSGPGSFTGLRIWAAIVNTLSHELKIPLFDHHGRRQEIILPDYGRPARITPPKK